MRSSGNSVRYEGLACCVVSTLKKEIAGIINNYLFVCGLHSLLQAQIGGLKNLCSKNLLFVQEVPLGFGGNSGLLCLL